MNAAFSHEELKDFRSKLASIERQLQDIISILRERFGESPAVSERAAAAMTAMRELAYELEIQAFRELNAPRRSRSKRSSAHQ
jgi:division protein CdvB (Snf7/Vps24/ESCRT-III family)